MRTWPPSTKGAWYSSDSAQQICSGSHDGTVAARVPPGLSTRKISSRATWSSLTCSSTSLAMMRSKVFDGNGRWRASPLVVAAIEPGSVPGFAGLAHGAEQAADVLELRGGVVEGDDAGALAERLEGVSSGAAAHVEQQVARLHAEPVEPDRQHY